MCLLPFCLVRCRYYWLYLPKLKHLQYILIMACLSHRRFIREGWFSWYNIMLFWNNLFIFSILLCSYTQPLFQKKVNPTEKNHFKLCAMHFTGTTYNVVKFWIICYMFHQFDYFYVSIRTVIMLLWVEPEGKKKDGNHQLQKLLN